MSQTLRLDDPRTVSRLDSVACILEWTSAMSASERQRFLVTLVESDEAVRQAVAAQVDTVKRDQATPPERQQALSAIVQVLRLDPASEDGGASLETSTQQDSFVARLKDVMAAKRISQQELADRLGCSQPAVSQMLSRMHRPRKATILKLAEAVNVAPRELWPDLEVAEMLDAVADFERDDYTMTAEEAAALGDAAKKNRPRISVKSLPTRPK